MVQAWLAITLASAATAQDVNDSHLYRHWPAELMWVAIGPAEVPPGTEVGSVMAIGPVIVKGSVTGDVVTVGGRITIAPGGVVAGCATAICATIEVAEGGRLLGEQQAAELTESALSLIGCADQPAGELILGDREFTGPSPTQAVVVGGDALVRANSGLAEVIVLGGNLYLDPGTQVRAARVFGGTLQRADTNAGAQDETFGPVILRCAGHTAPDQRALARWSTTCEEGTESIRVSAYSESWNHGEMHASVFAPSLRLELALRAKCGLRSTRPAAQNLNDWVQGYTSTGWTAWPRRQLWVPADREVDYQHSAAIGMGLRLDATVEKPDQRGGSRAQRSLTLGCPSVAAGLVGEDRAQ